MRIYACALLGLWLKIVSGQLMQVYWSLHQIINNGDMSVVCIYAFFSN